MVIDAWSINLLVNQVIEYYNMLKNGFDITKMKNPSYIDYILSEEEYKYSEKFKKNKDFWNNKFHTTPECTSLKQHVAGYIDTKAERKTFIVPEELSLKIRNFCKQYTKSAFSLFMSVMYIYIYRITMKKDIVLGTPILNRSNIKEKETFGMFISTIPVRMTVDENLSFNEYIEMVSKELMLFLKNQKYPFELILRDFRETNNTSDSLYDVVVSYQNASLDKTTYLENYKGRWHFNENQVSIKAGCP